MVLKTETLYQKLGGGELVSAMLTEFINRMLHDECINYHFIGLNKTDLRQHIISYFNTYILDGPRDPLYFTLKKVHSGFQITSDEYEIAVNHLYTALKHHSVSLKDIATILAYVRVIKPHIINH